MTSINYKQVDFKRMQLEPHQHSYSEIFLEKAIQQDTSHMQINVGVDFEPICKGQDNWKNIIIRSGFAAGKHRLQHQASDDEVPEEVQERLFALSANKFDEETVNEWLKETHVTADNCEISTGYLIQSSRQSKCQNAIIVSENLSQTNTLSEQMYDQLDKIRNVTQCGNQYMQVTDNETVIAFNSESLIIEPRGPRDRLVSDESRNNKISKGFKDNLVLQESKDYLILQESIDHLVVQQPSGHFIVQESSDYLVPQKSYDHLLRGSQNCVPMVSQESKDNSILLGADDYLVSGDLLVDQEIRNHLISHEPGDHLGIHESRENLVHKNSRSKNEEGYSALIPTTVSAYEVCSEATQVNDDEETNSSHDPLFSDYIGFSRPSITTGTMPKQRKYKSMSRQNWQDNVDIALDNYISGDFRKLTVVDLRKYVAAMGREIYYRETGYSNKHFWPIAGVRDPNNNRGNVKPRQPELQKSFVKFAKMLHSGKGSSKRKFGSAGKDKQKCKVNKAYHGNNRHQSNLSSLEESSSLASSIASPLSVTSLSASSSHSKSIKESPLQSPTCVKLTSLGRQPVYLTQSPLLVASSCSQNYANNGQSWDKEKDDSTVHLQRAINTRSVEMTVSPTHQLIDNRNNINKPIRPTGMHHALCLGISQTSHSKNGVNDNYNSFLRQNCPINCAVRENILYATFSFEGLELSSPTNTHEETDFFDFLTGTQ